MHKTKRIKTPTCALLTVNNKVFNWGVTSILNTKNFFLFCKTKNHSTIQQENTMLKSSALTVLFHRDMRVSCKYEKRGRVNIRNPSLILCNQSFNLSPILLHSILNVNVVGLNYSLLSLSLSPPTPILKIQVFITRKVCNFTFVCNILKFSTSMKYVINLSVLFWIAVHLFIYGFQDLGYSI